MVERAETAIRIRTNTGHEDPEPDTMKSSSTTCPTDRSTDTRQTHDHRSLTNVKMSRHVSSHASLSQNQQVTNVIAASEIPVGSRSASFPLHSILKVSHVDLQLRKIKTPASAEIRVKVDRDGELSVSGGVLFSTLSHDFFWPKWIQLAPDCHTQNVKLSRTRSEAEDAGTVVLQVVKKIHEGEPLYLWFGEELLMGAGIPSYLTPAHIKGKQFEAN